MISDNDYWIYLTRPTSLILIAAIIFTAVLPSIRQMRSRRHEGNLAAH